MAIAVSYVSNHNFRAQSGVTIGHPSGTPSHNFATLTTSAAYGHTNVQPAVASHDFRTQAVSAFGPPPPPAKNWGTANTPG